MKNIQKLLVLTLLFNVPAYGAQIKKDTQAKPAAQAPAQNNTEMITPDQMDDQKKAMVQQTFYNLQEPATHSIEFQKNEKEYIEILRALLELEEERQELQTTTEQQNQTIGNLPSVVAFGVNGVKSAFRASSKSGSFGGFVPLCNWPRWFKDWNFRNNFRGINNKFIYEIQPSVKNPGLLTVNIHADEVTDREVHDDKPQPKHVALTALLRKIDKQSKTTNESTDTANVKGQIKGKAFATWGASKRISIECKPALLAYLMKEKVRKQLEKQKQTEEEALRD